MKKSNYLQSARAKKTLGQTVKVGGTVKIAKKGKKPITFKKGGLHASLGVPQGNKIPAGKMAQAKAGKYGAKAKKQAIFAEGVLKAGRATAARGRGKKR